MMETIIARLVDDGIAETVARALEDFRGRVVTITIQERKPKTKKGEGNHGSPKEDLSAVDHSGGSDRDVALYPEKA